MKKCFTYKYNMLTLNLIAILFAVPLIALYIFLIRDFEVVSFPILLVILWAILHEIIHGLAFAICRDVKPNNIVFGAEIEKGFMYCMCKQEISRKSIFISLLAPLVLIGLVTLPIGVWLKSDILIFLSVFNILGAIGDLMVSILLLKLPRYITYIDFQDPAAFTITSQEDIKDIKVPGIKCTEVYEYDKKRIKWEPSPRIKMSKVSIVILVICLLSLVSFIIPKA